ncbi:helix-loop-helix DNA-binding domain-containing protein [Apiospora rasikravindrae]|uniref:Helix-loop-helix DNA-binding domain-containing protein n=1 Tax=Apiospora rasikravindrae TaxID=990691 RepID=A0ABR1UAU8_9PEZI
MANEQHRPASQKLPAGLAGVLNPEENRDSAYFSCTDASSKHTSTASGVGINVLSPSSTSTGYHSTDKTPSPTTTNMLPQPLHSPVGSMSITSMVSPTTPGSASFARPHSLEVNPNGASLLLNGAPDSRRESVDSRINQGFGDMKLGNSPYASHNQSTTSIQGSLAQQRNPRAGIENLSMHRISNGYQPSADRNPPEAHPKIRTAPAITGPATSNIARAAEPTKGQAWAFPEEEIQRMPSLTNLHDSRRSSIAESIASSQFTTESRLPPGQRRLDDGLGNDFNQRLSTASTDFPAVHHHSLQHKQLSDLQSEESSPHSGAQPYSRTPELRVSHKLAERKRRTEMKELFEQLRDLMPQERGSKASKWEILTKAIAEHQRQQDHLKQLTVHYQNSAQESELLRREVERLQLENGQLRAANGQGGPAPASHAVSSQPPPADPYAQQAQYATSRPELPPLRTLGTTMSNGPDSMTGVQYEGQRPNGFRPEPARF